MKNFFFILFLCVLLLQTNCKKASLRQIEQVVKAELVTFDQAQVPEEFKAAADNHRILVLGETHYVQEHQEYLTVLLKEFHDLGYRIFFNETFHCFNWMIDDYINGVRSELPDYIRLFDHHLLEAVRNYNNQLPESERFRYYFMDVNHWKDNFVSSILEIEKILGPQTVFEEAKAKTLDSKSYQTSLENLKQNLAQQRAELEGEWGKKWFERIEDIVAVEIKSSKYRVNGDEVLREQIMVDNIKSKIPGNTDVKAMVNTGMFHAQKETLMGEPNTRLAKYLSEEYPNRVYSIAFSGIEGERLQNFSDENPLSFNLNEDAKKRDLVRIIGEHAGESLSFLSLNDEVFQEDMQVTYTAGSQQAVAPGKQFDAIITYPHITVLQSLSTYK